MVIGLGHFGMSLARSLATRGVEVLAVDCDDVRVRTASAFASEVLCFDATEEERLSQTVPSRRDVCICAIGDEATEASIIVTALLKQMGARRLVARANDKVHERILRLIGADEVVNPERAFGERFANLVLYDGVKAELKLGGGLTVTEVEVPESFLGRSLIDLALPRNYGVTVVAVRAGDGERVDVAPDPSRPFAAGDIVVLVAPSRSIARMLKKVG